MRTGFFLLLFANLALFAWQFMTANNGSSGVATVISGHMKPLVLLSERASPAPMQAVEPTPTELDAAATQTVPEVIEPLRACYTLGPFRASELLAEAEAELNRLGLQPNQRERQEREQYGYQVYLPAFASRQAAIDAVRGLPAKGVREYYVMTDAGFENAISLGLFRDKRHADQHIADLKAKGIKPQIIGRYREVTLYWLDYVDSEQMLPLEQLHALFGSDTVQRLPRECA